MAWWDTLTATIWRLLDEHGQLTAFVLLFLEETGLPPLIPGDILMILIGMRLAAGTLNLLEVLAVLQLATVLGGSVLYAVAAWGGHELVYRLGRPIGATPERLDAAAASLARRGEWAVALGRLAPGLSTITTVACGVLGFPYRRFLPALFVGGLLRLFVFVALGYLFGPPVLAVAARVHLPFELMASVAAVAVLTLWTVRSGRGCGPSTTEALGRPPLAERLHDGLLAGLLGAVQSTLLVNVAIHLFDIAAYQAPSRALAASGLIGPGQGPTLLILAAPAFVILPTLFGAAYGVWAADALPGPQWLRGAWFALVPLAVSWLVILPLAGAGLFGLGLGAGPIPALGEAARHLAFGLTLGVTYAALACRRVIRRTASPTLHPA